MKNGAISVDEGLQVTAGRDVTLEAGYDTTLKGAQVQANGSIDADVGGDLTVASVQDTSRIDGDSKGGSLGLSTGLDGKVDALNGSVSYGKEKGRKAWVEEQSALIAKGDVDVTVGGHTQLDGSVIASTEGDVTLDTETFDYSDIQDHDTYKNVNGSISGSIGIGGDDGKKSTSDPLDQIALLPTIEGSYEASEKEQITRATVAAPNGDATITIRANPSQGIEGLNNALEKAQEITKDKKTKVKVYVSGESLAEVVNGFQGLREAVATAADKVEAVANLIEAQLAVLPEDLKVKGEAIDGLYRDLITQGIEPEEAYEIINSPMGEMLQVQTYLQKNGGDTDLSNLSYDERQSLYKILGTSIQLASTNDVLSGIGITLEQVQQDAGLYLLNNYKKGFSWAADTLRENPEAATAIIGMTDMVANSVWSLMAAAEGGLEVVNPSTNGQESPEFSLDYYASEYEAGVKRLIRDKEALGEGTEAIQQGAIDLFLETIKDSDISPEKTALYATVAASSVIVTRVVAKRLTGGSGNTRKEVNELADTLDNLSNEVNFVVRKVEAEKVARSMPYGSRQWRDNYDSFYGNENVTSTTIPPYSAKNVKFAGKRHPDTDVVYDLRGFPIFDDIAKYDTRLPLSDFKSASYQTQMRMATRDLRNQIVINPTLKSQFNSTQLSAIQSGKAKIPNYTWHHHQDSGRMQLVLESVHKETGHIGGEAISNGQ